MPQGNTVILRLAVVITIVMTTVGLYAQTPDNLQNRLKVVDGILQEIKPDTVNLQNNILADSTIAKKATQVVDSTNVKADLKKDKKLTASPTSRYSSIFRDTIPISRMCAISIVAPGFSQLYNKQAWKIPILYGTVGTLVATGINQNKFYNNYRTRYDLLVKQGASRAEIDPVQTKMIKYNTSRTVLFAGALATYIYFIGDGAVNYNGPANSVKKATTLSTIFPGAGQFYNKSYWKVPIVLGAFATMGYVIDYNSRGYKRFKLAYNQVTDDDPNTVDEFDGRYSADYLRTLRNSYRRNRDMSIIITCGVYLLNIVEAHVDAQLKDYDISDDLSMTVEPTMLNLYTMKDRNINGFGMSLKFAF